MLFLDAHCNQLINHFLASTAIPSNKVRVLSDDRLWLWKIRKIELVLLKIPNELLRTTHILFVFQFLSILKLETVFSRDINNLAVFGIFLFILVSWKFYLFSNHVWTLIRKYFVFNRIINVLFKLLYETTIYISVSTLKINLLEFV